MTTFDNREKGHELKFAKDEELNFKITARRNKLLGLWVAEKLGKKDAAAIAYAKDVVAADFEVTGDSDVIDKVIKDLGNAGIKMSAPEIQAEMERLMPVAREQIVGK